jgi:hypothetical protein
MEKARDYYLHFYEFWKDGAMDRERVEKGETKIRYLLLTKLGLELCPYPTRNVRKNRLYAKSRG